MDATAATEPQPRRIALPSRGGSMAALDFGPIDRPVDVVFSHANGFNAGTYRSILGPLGRDLHVLALDLRGHGETRLPTDRESWQGWVEYARDLVALLEAATDGPVVLAGHSLGATTSLVAAALAPERARCLVLFEPVLLKEAPDWDYPLAKGALKRRADFPDHQAAIDAYRGRGPFKTWSETQLVDYVRAGFQAAPDGGVTLACRPEWEATNYALQESGWERALAGAKMPVRIFEGEMGSAVEASRETLAANPNVTVERIPGTTHFLPMERPDLVREALLAAAG